MNPHARKLDVGKSNESLQTVTKTGEIKTPDSTANISLGRELRPPRAPAEARMGHAAGLSPVRRLRQPDGPARPGGEFSERVDPVWASPFELLQSISQMLVLRDHPAGLHAAPCGHHWAFVMGLTQSLETGRTEVRGKFAKRSEDSLSTARTSDKQDEGLWSWKRGAWARPLGPIDMSTLNKKLKKGNATCR